MSENISLEFLRRQLAAMEETKDKLSSETHGANLRFGGGDGTGAGMDLTTYRLDQAEKRAEASDARMVRIEDKLGDIQVSLAGLATKDGVRNWGIGIIAIVIAAAVGIAAVLLQSSNNELAAFQSGLSAIQAVSAAHDLAPAPTPAKQ